jgi:3-deoxy-D-manno-octulosonic-acid transferase
MRWLYSISLQFYRLFIVLASPFKPKAKQWLVGRKNWRKHFASKKEAASYLWFHAASLGEFESAKPIIEAVKLTYPNKKIWLTFFSPSGYELRKNDPIADVITYLPLDSRKSARDFLNIINPEIAVFIRYEFWLHYIDELHARRVPLVVASATFREGQFLLRRYGQFIKKRAQRLFAILVQDEKSRVLLQRHGFSNVTIAGDTRVDRVVEIAATANRFPLVEKFIENKKVFIAGSCWPPDEAIFLDVVLQDADTKVILAPHEVHEANIVRLVRRAGQNTVRWSQLNDITAINAKVLILDNIGLLAQIYQYGDVAFVGGGFTTGIHNLLEATVYGCPVFFGPNHKAFPEGAGLIEAGGGFCISRKAVFEQQYATILSHPANLEKAAAAAKSYTLQRAGATAKTLGVIKKALEKPLIEI